LQHGSILLDGTQAAVSGLLLNGGSTHALPGAGSITLLELMGDVPAWPALGAAIALGFEVVFGTRLAPHSLGDHEAERAADLEQVYRSDAWTWRR
jgi:hypothetical protein